LRNHVFFATVISLLLVKNCCSNEVRPFFQKLLYEVVLNSQDTHNVTLFLKDKKNNLYVDTLTIKSWGLILPKEKPVMYFDQEFFNLSDYEGFSYQIDERNLIISLNFPEIYFESTNIFLSNNGFIMPQKSPLGGYINYNFYSTGPINNKQTGDYVQNSGLFSGTIFGPYGNLNTEYLIKQGAAINQNTSGSNNPIRLQSFYQLDLPDKMQTLILGDSTTAAGAWGQSIAFGGISYQTNFGTQPNYATYPLPVAAGVASIPTSVQLYSNNNLISSQKVTSGPFSINNVPVVNGAGTLNVLTTNVLGQQVITLIPYYASQQLLKPGLQNFSYQLGFIRENYGLNSNLYGPLIGVLSDKIGITNHLILEGDIEATTQQQNYGMSFACSLFNYFIWNGSVAGSQNTLGAGTLLQSGLEHQAETGFSFGGSVTLTSAKYLQIAASPNNLSPSTQIQAFTGATLFRDYSFGMSLTELNYRGGSGSLNFISFNLSKNMTRKITLTLSALSNITGSNNHSINLIANFNFGADYNLSFSNTYEGNNGGNPAYYQLITDFNKNTPVGPGYGYELQTTQYNTHNNGQYSNNYQATYNLNTLHIDTSMSLARQGYTTLYQANATGAIIYIDKGFYFSPQVQGSFALAETPKLSNVNIYYNNQFIGKTNASGNVIIPNLNPYTDNKVTVHPAELPIDTEIEATEVDPVPYANQGVIIKFPIHKIRPVFFRLNQANKINVPVGAKVYLNGDKKNYYVGYDGEVYLPQLQNGKNVIKADWEAGSCTTVIHFDKGSYGKNPVLNLGVFFCKNSTI
jgi:outer membrane usher protein